MVDIKKPQHSNEELQLRNQDLTKLNNTHLGTLRLWYQQDLSYFWDLLLRKFQGILSEQKDINWSKWFLNTIQTKSNDILTTLQNSPTALSLEETKEKLIFIAKEMKRRDPKNEQYVTEISTSDDYTHKPSTNMSQLLKHDSAVVRQYLDADLMEKLGYVHVNNYTDLLNLFLNIDSKTHIINAANTEYHGKPLEITSDERTQIEALLRAKWCL